jgi:prolipoprotein diacylglyceryltransferase
MFKDIAREKRTYCQHDDNGLWGVNMIFQLIVSIVIVILGLTIFFTARKYEKHQPDFKKPNTI